MASVSAETGGRRVTAGDLLKKERLKVEVPMIEIDTLESICTGFRMDAMSCEDGGIQTHGGCGSIFVVSMNWKGKHATITAQELLAAWVRTFNADDAKNILEANLSLAEEDLEPNRRSARDRGDEEDLVDEDEDEDEED